jgi:hypothetical protein
MKHGVPCRGDNCGAGRSVPDYLPADDDAAAESESFKTGEDMDCVRRSRIPMGMKLAAGFGAMLDSEALDWSGCEGARD